jgi:hypothetical protein
MSDQTTTPQDVGAADKGKGKAVDPQQPQDMSMDEDDSSSDEEVAEQVSRPRHHLHILPPC